MNEAFVFNVFFNGLGVIRALGENGVPVRALDSSKKPVGKYSKYTKAFNVVTNPALNAEQFVKELIEIGKELNEKPVLFPTNDVWSIAVSKYKQQLEKYFLTYNPDYSVIKKIIDKRLFYNIMEKENILVPQTYGIKRFDDLEKIKKELIYPLILKPTARMEINRKSCDTRIYNLNRIIEIKNFEDFFKYKDLIKNYEFIIQQKIEGLSNNMYTVGIYADKKSKVRAAFCGRKVRGYPVEYGDCIAGESYWVDELVEQSKKLVKILGYTGIAEIEYKYNQVDGKYYLIEMNPRTWSWIGITPKAGVNLPLIAYKDARGEEIPEYIEMDKSKKVLWTRSIDDRFNCKRHHKNVDEEDFLKSEKEWKESLKNYDYIVYADLDPEDMAPGIFWKKSKKVHLIKNFPKLLYRKLAKK
ncbi:hypothetical protein CN13_06520 [Petrotoga sp. HKA.pet.4.5]|uniref:carboxylate--amine ligase n=1 Tax=Petrotoga sp. HKA.pet.4.5 TaxID=1473155 RepID=UPI000FF63033|nr:ATP-grasp domain-containing protein [Petrotoga sp. HKA.pet.4.5]RLL89240.1 hypothetical protein CN13_06520 [Petrotoga sp. HKA.pet.4.5]